MKNVIKLMSAMVLAVFSASVFAIPMSVTGDGIVWTLGGSTTSNTGSFTLSVDVSGAVSPLDSGPFYLSAFSLKNFGSAATISSLSAPIESWDSVNEGLKGKGCKTNGTYDALCVSNDGSVTGAPSTLADFSFSFVITLAGGDLFPEDYTHLKVRWVDADGKKVGDLISQDIAWEPNTIPEPSIVALLGIGLIGMGAAARRKKTV
jgi:hypothetical protein